MCVCVWKLKKTGGSCVCVVFRCLFSDNGWLVARAWFAEHPLPERKPLHCPPAVDVAGDGRMCAVDCGGVGGVG